jgi:5-methylcytosine-specific restriction protein A
MVASFQLCGGHCEGVLKTGKRCNAVLVPGRWHCDHHNPDALGGQPTLENARCLCLECHAAKTGIDMAYIAQSHQREAKNIGVPWPKPSIKSRGFPKAEKPKREQLPLPPRKVDAYGGRQ